MTQQMERLNTAANTHIQRRINLTAHRIRRQRQRRLTNPQHMVLTQNTLTMMRTNIRRDPQLQAIIRRVRAQIHRGANPTARGRLDQTQARQTLDANTRHRRG